MKQNIIFLFTMLLVFFTLQPVFAFSLNPLSWFGGGDTEVKVLKDSTDKKFSDISSELGVVKDNVTTVATKVGSMEDSIIQLTSKIETTLNAKVEANVGYKKEEHTSTATTATQSGNNNVASTNDSKLMGLVVTTMSNGYTYVIALLVAYIVRVSYQRAKLESRIMDFVNKQEDGQARYITLLENVAYKAMNVPLDAVVKKKE